MCRRDPWVDYDKLWTHTRVGLRLQKVHIRRNADGTGRKGLSSRREAGRLGMGYG